MAFNKTKNAYHQTKDNLKKSYDENVEIGKEEAKNIENMAKDGNVQQQDEAWSTFFEKISDLTTKQKIAVIVIILALIALFTYGYFCA